MWDVIKENSFVVGALTGSLAAYLLGLLVSYWRREKRWLGYSVISRNIVQRGHSKLSILYDGKHIVRLDSHSIVVRNIGNCALHNVPVQIKSQGGGAIVEHELCVPDGAFCSASADSADKLVVTTDLINPGEVVTIGLTVADSGDGKISIKARGELLEVKEIGERLTTDELLQALLTVTSSDFGGAFSRLLLELYRRRRRN